MNMNLFKKVSVLLVAFVFVAAGVVGGLVYHINDAAEAAKVDYKNQIEAYHSEKDEKIKNDVADFTSSEINRLRSETSQYLNEKLSQDYQVELNQKSAEIKQVTDQKIEEIKKYIDELLDGE